jgi:hypothetical protein
MNVALGRIQLSIIIQDRPVRKHDHALATPAHNLADAAYRGDSLAEVAYRVEGLANACRADRDERPGGEVEIMSCPDGSWRPLFRAPGARR